MTKSIHIIGAGLAGSEAAWQIAKRGLNVTLYEMRPHKMTDAHHTGNCAELVCSNSFRSDDYEYNAVGLLHEEMRRMNSLIMHCADKHKVPAGGALAVDRDGFSEEVTKKLKENPYITIKNEEITELPSEDTGLWVIATGPLTSDHLAQSIQQMAGVKELAFFDAIAPIVYKDSIDFDIAWYQSRYDKGDGKDYINCPMDKQEYEVFIQALLDAPKTEFKEWEKNTPYFEGCLPIEVMASRGIETLRFGPMKPVGLTNPKTDRYPYAVVQLRQDNALGTLYNIVGFQTKLIYSAQKEVFKLIPGLQTAEFARLGGIHRNTFINAPELLDTTLRAKALPHIRFAGQITGCEGYIESASIGLMAGIFTACEVLQKEMPQFADVTALGSMLNHVTGGADAKHYQPMNINFGLFPPLASNRDEKGKKLGKREKASIMSKRALEALEI
jgi:methylenetetrahydrofolate--tRNA-(uracil-5-)-methyltransferase